MDKFLVTLEAVFYLFQNIFSKSRKPKIDDAFAVYIKKKKGYDDVTKKVTLLAFLPEEVNLRFEKSAFLINNLHPSKIIMLGYRWTIINYWPKRSGNRKNKIKAYARIIAGNIFSQNLKIEYAPSPHPRHHNLIDWNVDKSFREIQAFELALRSELIEV